VPKILTRSLLPALRRSTFRAPDPEAARAFDPAKPDASAAPGADAVEQRAAAVAAVLADLDLPQAAPEVPVRRRSTALSVPERTEAVAVDVVAEPTRTAPIPTEDGEARDHSDAADGEGTVPPIESSTRRPHPRHRVDRTGNRRPSSGLRPRRAMPPVVTRVQHTDEGTKVWVGGCTKDADYWDVDQALASGGGAVAYFSLS
jgi:hypothetical protein